MQRFLRDELRLPILSLDGDCLIKGRDNLMKTRVLAFLESLISSKAKADNRVQTSEAPRHSSATTCDEFFVGIDVGSATTKVVVLDSDMEIRSSIVLPTGSDNEKTVEQSLARVWESLNGADPNAVSSVVSTGIGRGNVPFEHDEATEILCHTRGVLHQIPEAGTIIDIGGQDTKAMLVEPSISRLNASCAAGTGKFLEVIAAAMNMSAEEMNKLDEAADRAASVSKMCTVFAESEVVNRIASGDDVGEIARGVHEMVASKAATLVRQLSSQIHYPIVFSGGVAKNAAVVRALQRNLGIDIRVPEKPQLTGALGAALLAVERWGDKCAP